MERYGRVCWLRFSAFSIIWDASMPKRHVCRSSINLLRFWVATVPERCPSGLRSTLGKRV